MPDIQTVAILVSVIFVARALESVLGFGGTIMALPILAILLPELPLKSVLVPVLALGNIVCTLGIVWVGRKHIIWREYLIIFIYALIGLPLGFWAARSAPENLLKFILGAFVTVFAIISLLKALRHANGNVPGAGACESESPLKRMYLRFMIVAGGVMHGMFTTGGPCIVVYATRALATKGLFRVTLAMVWLTLNIVMAGGWIANDVLTPTVWSLAGLTVPFIVLSVFVGDYLHHKLPEDTFRKLAYAILALSGISLLYKTTPGVFDAVGAFITAWQMAP